LNDRWYEFTGQTPDSALPDGWAEVLHPEDAEPTRREWDAARAHGCSYEVRCRYRRKDGVYRWHIARAEAVRAPGGEIVRWFGTSTDIHEQTDAVERLELALDAGAIQGTWVWDLPSDRVTADERFCETFGISTEEASTGFPIQRAVDAIHPEDREQVQTAIQRAIDEGDGYRCEYRVKNAAGVYRWVEASGKVQVAADGTPVRFPGVAVDVEARRAAEERLRKSQAELRAVYDAVPVGIVLAEAPSGRITGGNAEVERVFGHQVLPSTDVASYRDWVSFHADGREVQADEYPLTLALRGEAERPELEVLYRRGDGRHAWIRLVASPIRDADGKISGAVVAALDIDKRRRAQQELQDLNGRLETEVQQRTAERDRMWRLSTDLMLVAGFDGTIEAVNPAWTALLGWSDDELLGRSFMNLVHPDDSEATLAEMASLERGVTTFRFTNRYRALAGDYRWISWTAVPGDQHIHAVGRDITAERLAAAELEQAQEALRQSQKLEAMGQLTGGVAHDFNNLLSPIIGGLDLLQRRDFGDERAKRTIGGALASAERAKTLVQRLLAFARRQPLQPTAVDVAGTIKGMAGLLASTLGPRIDLKVEVSHELPAARADANQLEMALLNLTVNARDAMPDGGQLSITAHHERNGPTSQHDAAGGYVRVVVRDTGKGMDAETLARCIEPFFSTKGIGQGTGLGLSMVHGLAAQLSGALSIDSEVGRGTIIELWLPVAGSAAPGAEGDAVDPLPRRAGRALVVDDEDLVRASTAEMLEELGYDTMEAVSGTEALRILEEESFDLLVTDHLMPGVTGTELARLTHDRAPQTKVLIVSGYAGAEGLDPAYKRLTKPFRQSELAAALEE
jgi:PAS domain S-box-containing protein